jgi:hypothetical protein
MRKVFVMRHLRVVCEKVVYIDSAAMKRRSKFTLGARLAVSPKPSKVCPTPPKRESPKIQARAAAPPPPLSPAAADAVEEEVFEDEPIPVKMPRAQLDLEYVAVVREREPAPDTSNTAGVIGEPCLKLPMSVVHVRVFV